MVNASVSYTSLLLRSLSLSLSLCRGWKTEIWEGGTHVQGFISSPLIPKVSCETGAGKGGIARLFIISLS